jgi:hypothetical protein
LESDLLDKVHPIYEFDNDPMKMIKLNFKVSDSGIGIKTED